MAGCCKTASGEIVDRNPGKSVRVSYFGQHGKRIFYRHILNDRFQQDTVDQYCTDIKKYGVRRGIRGDTWCIMALEDSNNPHVRYVVSGMHLIEAVYKAYEEGPTNPQVPTHCPRAFVTR